MDLTTKYVDIDHPRFIYAVSLLNFLLYYPKKKISNYFLSLIALHVLLVRVHHFVLQKERFLCCLGWLLVFVKEHYVGILVKFDKSGHLANFLLEPHLLHIFFINLLDAILV